MEQDTVRWSAANRLDIVISVISAAAGIFSAFIDGAGMMLSAAVALAIFVCLLILKDRYPDRVRALAHRFGLKSLPEEIGDDASIDGPSPTIPVGERNLPVALGIARVQLLKRQLYILEVNREEVRPILEKIQDHLRAPPEGGYGADDKLIKLFAKCDEHLMSIDNAAMRCFQEETNISRRAFIVGSQPIPSDLGLSSEDARKYRRFYDQLKAYDNELPAVVGLVKKELFEGERRMDELAGEIRLWRDKT